LVNNLDLQLQREKIYRQQQLFSLWKRSNLKIEDIADKLCIEYETCRNQIYSKKGLKLKTWIKYYILFTKSIKELDHQKDFISSEQ
jgi:hypothetical protein